MLGWFRRMCHADLLPGSDCTQSWGLLVVWLSERAAVNECKAEKGGGGGFWWNWSFFESIPQLFWLSLLARTATGTDSAALREVAGAFFIGCGPKSVSQV